MKNKMMIATIAFACATLFGSAVAATPAAGDASRDELARAVVQKWSAHVNKSYPIGASAWSVEMAPAFEAATLEELKAAANAKSFDDMNKLLLGGPIGDGTQALGDIDSDLVFVPVTPCRIIDTRLAGGPIAANTTRGFDINVLTDFSFQGGSATDCNVGAVGSFAAAEINFTVVTPSIGGYITAFPFGGTQPLAATLNYGAGAIVGNDVVVKLDQSSASNELSVYSFASTHLVADIVGYYTAVVRPATQLDCVEVAGTGVSIAAGASGTNSTPNCPATYEITGGGCTSSSFEGRVVTSRSFDSGVNSQNHFCAFKNEGGAAATFTAYGRCCRVPGQ